MKNLLIILFLFYFAVTSLPDKVNIAFKELQEKNFMPYYAGKNCWFVFCPAKKEPYMDLIYVNNELVFGGSFTDYRPISGRFIHEGNLYII